MRAALKQRVPARVALGVVQWGTPSVRERGVCPGGSSVDAVQGAQVLCVAGPTLAPTLAGSAGRAPRGRAGAWS